MIENIDGVDVKYCPRCDKHVPVEMFSKNKHQSDGLYGYCKVCQWNTINEWRENNREKVNQQYREYYQNNPDRHHKQLFTKHLNNAVCAGKITKPNECSLCGSTERIQGHHPSYEPGQELNVIWLCIACHTALYIQLRREQEESE